MQKYLQILGCSYSSSGTACGWMPSYQMIALITVLKSSIANYIRVFYSIGSKHMIQTIILVHSTVCPIISSRAFMLVWIRCKHLKDLGVSSKCTNIGLNGESSEKGKEAWGNPGNKSVLGAWLLYDGIFRCDVHFVLIIYIVQIKSW